jgi:hypothetical protein
MITRTRIALLPFVALGLTEARAICLQRRRTTQDWIDMARQQRFEGSKCGPRLARLCRQNIKQFRMSSTGDGPNSWLTPDRCVHGRSQGAAKKIGRAVDREVHRSSLEQRPVSSRPTKTSRHFATLLEETIMNHASTLSVPTPAEIVQTPVAATVRRRGLRRVGALLAGLVATVVSTTAIDMVLHATGVFPGWQQRMLESLYLLALAYRLICNAAGGYVAARLAGDRPVENARTLGVIGTVLASAGFAVALKMGPEFGPVWYPLALVVTAIPSAAAGGWLRQRQLASTAGRVA